MLPMLPIVIIVNRLGISNKYLIKVIIYFQGEVKYKTTYVTRNIGNATVSERHVNTVMGGEFLVFYWCSC